jgi:predicted dithiol-disulfide oxidoreductase (DUF899 family)
VVLVRTERIQCRFRGVVHARAAVGGRNLQLRPPGPPHDEAPGISAFALLDGEVFHTYSAYSRGLDPLNGAYQLLDLTPKGPDEAGLAWPMAWLRRYDAYD